MIQKTRILSVLRFGLLMGCGIYGNGNEHWNRVDIEALSKSKLVRMEKNAIKGWKKKRKQKLKEERINLEIQRRMQQEAVDFSGVHVVKIRN